jgi:hypothetical protein
LRDLAGGGRQALTADPAAPFGEGTFRVGIDIAPGVWHATAQPGRSCYWERLGSFTGDFEELLGNDIGDGNRIAEILPTDVGFGSSGCGTWVEAG